MKIIALLVLMAPMFAQELTVSGVRFDAKKRVVTFDVAAAGAKPVRSWLISVQMKRPGTPDWSGTSSVTPQMCTAAAAAQSWHCQADLDFGQEGGSDPVPAVHVDAVLYADGTASGDLRALQLAIDNARIRLHALEYWQARYKAAGSMAHVFDGTPDEIAYSSAGMNEREVVQLFAAKATPAQIDAMFKSRVEMARVRAKLFPEPATPYAPPESTPSQVAVADRAPKFPIVRQEEHEGGIRLVMRNDYDKEIVAFAFIEHRPDGQLMRASSGHAVAPGGLEEFEYGAMKNPVELACVVFRDGTAEGDASIAQKMRDGWAGRKAEKARLLPLVRAAIERGERMDKLIADLKAHPQEQPDATHSIDYVLGEQAERKTVARELMVESPAAVLKELQD